MAQHIIVSIRNTGYGKYGDRQACTTIHHQPSVHCSAVKRNTL